MYQAVCDGCEMAIKHLFASRKEAEDYAVLMCGWFGKEGNLYCPYCTKHYKEMGVL